MTAAEGSMSICKKAKVMPTASASMLVATAIITSSFRLSASACSSSPPRAASQIILPPIKASRKKAIQWSNELM